MSAWLTEIKQEEISLPPELPSAKTYIRVGVSRRVFNLAFFSTNGFTILSPRTDSYCPRAFTQLDPIIFLTVLLVTILHLVKGLSRNASNAALRFLRLILQLSRAILPSEVTLAEPDRSRPSLFSSVDGVPSDIRIIIKALQIDLDIRRSVCCPRCFALYEREDCLPFCSEQSCGEPLFCSQLDSKGGTIEIPQRLYSTHSLVSWLARFVNRPGVENELNKSVLKTWPLALKTMP